MDEKLSRRAPEELETAIRHLKYELHWKRHYGYAMLFLREYILGSQTPEKLKEMKYSVDERHFLVQNYNEYGKRLYEAAYREWRTYAELTDQLFPSETSSPPRRWSQVWEDTVGAIWDELWDELCARHSYEYLNRPQDIPRPQAPPELGELQADNNTLSRIYACFEGDAVT